MGAVSRSITGHQCLSKARRNRSKLVSKFHPEVGLTFNIILILGAMDNIFHNISHILHFEQFERMHHCCGLCKHIVNKFMNLDLVMKMRNTFVKQYINKPSMHSIPVGVGVCVHVSVCARLGVLSV